MIKKLNPTSASHTIPYPDHKSEFEIHAAIYMTLLQAGINVRGEVQLYDCFGLHKTKASCRFDLVVFDGLNNPKLILEIKSHVVKHKHGAENTRQFFKYGTFGVPVWFVYGMDDIEQIVHDVKNISL